MIEVWKAIRDVGEDILLFGAWGLLFYWLLGLLGQPALKRDARWKRLLVCILPTLLWRGLLNYCLPVREFFYGAEGFHESSSTILTNGVSILVLLASGSLLYRNQKRQVLYLTLLFGALSEAMRFGLYGLAGRLFNGILDRSCQQVNAGAMEIDAFYRAVTLIQTLWNTIYLVSYLACLALAVRQCRKAHLAAERLPKGRELLYLTVPSLISLCFGFLMRSILLMTREGQLYSIFEDNESLYLLTPVVCVLCVGMMLGSLQIWSRIVGEEREKSELLVYQSRVESLEQYVGDLERMQEGLKGMKHDLRNYMADIQALLSLGEDPEVQKELGGYLRGMERTLDECGARCRTGNPVTDVLLNRYMQQARELGISAEWNFFFPGELAIDPFDMSIILNNGLNNALESCQRLPQGQRWMHVNGRSQGNMFLLEIRNGAKGQCRAVPGQGMKNMMRCARKYQGHMEWENGEGEFRLTVMLQGKAG